MRIGFVGTGTMGLPIAGHLIAAGHALLVYDAMPAAVQPLVDRGAALAESPAAVGAGADVVFLSLPGPSEIEAVVAGRDGILGAAAPGTIIVDLSTNSVAGARALATQCALSGVAFVDAPVSGGVAGAERGTLSVMVGAEPAAFERVQPLILSFARDVFHVGASGAGALAKLVNNQIFLCASVLLQEGFVMGAKAGMESSDLMRILNASSAGLYTKRAGFVLTRDFDKAVFKLGIAAKDVAVALESAEGLGVDMPVTTAALGVYRRALEMGLGDQVYSATLKVLETDAGVEVAPLQAEPDSR